MRVLLAIGSLSSGGAEKVLVQLANWLAAEGDDVTLITLAPTYSDFFPVDPRIRRVFPVSESRRLRLFQFIRILDREIARTDASVSFLTEMNLTVMLFALFRRKRVVVSERIHPDFHAGLAGLVAWLTFLLYRITATQVVVQSQGIAEEFERRGVTTVVIPNGVAFPSTTPPIQDRPQLAIVVGSLSARKRPKDILRAWRRVASLHPGWSLVFVGQGPIAPELEQLAEDLNLDGSVRFVGVQEDVAFWYRSARIFIMASEFEGTSNALLEAMSFGCACVVSDAPGDAADLLLDGRCGAMFPVGDISVMAALLDELLSDSGEQQRLSRMGRSRVESRSLEKSHRRWRAMLQAMTPILRQ